MPAGSAFGGLFLHGKVAWRQRTGFRVLSLGEDRWLEPEFVTPCVWTEFREIMRWV